MCETSTHKKGSCSGGCSGKCGNVDSTPKGVVQLFKPGVQPVAPLHQRLSDEIQAATKALKDVYPAVTVFGGARVVSGSDNHNLAAEFSKRLCNAGISVLTGGGPGIMEAANMGCKPDSPCSNARSVGLNIKLPNEQKPNEHLDISVDFKQFASRKIMLVRNSMAFVYFPGGLGTLDELFEVLTLLQTKKMPKRPVILVNSAVWNPLLDYLRSVILANGWMGEQDFDLITVVDTAEQAIAALKTDSWPLEFDPAALKALSI